MSSVMPIHKAKKQTQEQRQEVERDAKTRMKATDVNSGAYKLNLVALKELEEGDDEDAAQKRAF